MVREYTVPDILPARPRRVVLAFWMLLAALNLAAGLAISFSPERQTDIETIRVWGRAWLVDGEDIYAPGLELTDPDYPPHAIVALAVLGVGDRTATIAAWAIANLGLAVLSVLLALRVAEPRAPLRTMLLPLAMLLCWGGFRTMLQFSLLTLVAGLLTMRAADRRPILSGLCLTLAMMKPQMGLPFLVWALLSGHLRVMWIGSSGIAAGFAVYCLRAAADPLGVIARYAEILQMYYAADEEMIMVGLAQLRPLIASIVPGAAAASIAAAVIAVVLMLAIIGLGRKEAPGRLAVSAPPLVCVWSLLTFYHLTYGFILLLPVAAFALYASSPQTRSRRLALFCAMQALLMVDVPGVWARAAGALGSNPEATILAHADRIWMVGLFGLLFSIGVRMVREPA